MPDPSQDRFQYLMNNYADIQYAFYTPFPQSS